MKYITPILLLLIISLPAFSMEKSGGIYSKIDKFRKELSDNSKYPARNRLKLDGPQVYRAIINFGRENKHMLKTAFLESGDSLPATGTRPLSKEYRKLLSLDKEDFSSYRENLIIAGIFSPEIKRFSMITLSTTLIVSMQSKMHIPISESAKWQSFFMMAIPSYYLLSLRNDRITLLLEYGRHDKIILTYAFGEFTWMPESLEWWQKK